MKSFEWSIFNVLIALLFLSAFAPSAKGQQQDNYAQLEQAANLIRQGDLTRAETELTNLLKKTPLDANALNLLGVVKAQQQRQTEAETLFLKALKTSPRLSGAYVNLGRLYLDQKKNDRALWAFSQASAIAPDNAEVVSQLAALYVEKKEFARGLTVLESIARDSWRAEEHYLAATCYLALGRNEQALSTITSVRRIGPLDVNQAVAFSSLLRKFELNDDAIAILDNSLTQHQNSFELLSELGANYEARHEWSKADEYYRAALNVDPTKVDTFRSLARVATAAGNIEKALAHLVQARKLAPENPSVLYDFAVTAFRMNLMLDVLPVAEKLYKQKPDDPAYVHLLAVTRFRRDDKTDAETLLRKYIQLRPKDSLGYYLLGVTLYTVNRYAEASEAFQKSLALKDDADSAYMLGLIAKTEGDKARAINWLQRVKETAACFPAALTLLGTVYAEQNNLPSARKTLERAVQLNVRDLSAHYQLGLVYSKLGEKDRAKQMFEIADRLREEQRNEEVVTFRLIDPQN